MEAEEPRGRNVVRLALKYWQVAKASFQSQLLFRAQFISQVPTELLSVFLLYFFWTAVYIGRSTLGDFGYRDMLSYLFLAHVVSAFTAVEVEMRMAMKIVFGEIADVVMPINHQLYLFAQAFSDMIIKAVVRGVVSLSAGFLLFRIAFPGSFLTAVWVAASIALSVVLAFALSYLWGLLLVWMKDWWGGYGLTHTKRVMFAFFSGGLVPLTLFPPWFQKIAFSLPFQGIVHIPVSIYLGRIAPERVPSALLSQLVWAAVLWVAAIASARLAFRNLEVLEGAE